MNSPASRLLPVVVGAVLSFVVGLSLLSVWKVAAPPEAAGEADPPPPNAEAKLGPAAPAPEGAKPGAGEPRDVVLRLKGGDSRVELANTVGLLDPRGDFTVEMWARVNNPDGTQRFFGDRVARFTARPSVYGGWECGPQFFDREWGRLWANVAGADRDVGGVAGGGFNVTPVWHHVAYVNSGNRCVLYIDGRETAQTNTYQAPGPAPSPIGLSIGASPEGGDQGKFDGDVRAFRATSGARYRQRFVPPRKFRKDDGTVILLDFSGEGARIKDLAGNHDGKIVNADWALGAPPGPEQVPDKLTTPGLRLAANGFIELANTAGLLDGKEFCVEAWVQTPAFRAQRLHLFRDSVGGQGWGLYCNPKRGGDKKWEAKFSIGRQTWFENVELEPRTVYHIAVVRPADAGLQVFFNGEPPGGALSPDILPGTSNFFIGHSPTAPPDDDTALPGVEVHAFRASSRARYRGGFIPQQRFDKDAATLILLEFSGKGTILKDLAGDHHGRVANATWVPGTP